MEYKFRAYSKEYGMSPACSIFDIQIMDCEGLTDMSKVELMQFTGLYDCTNGGRINAEK
jgi:hypothetical protein